MGRKQTEATKRKISETKRRKAAEQRAVEVDPPLKRCSLCKCYKRRWAEFNTTMRVLADGSMRMHPSSWCKACQAQATAARREAMDPEVLAGLQKKWSADRRERERKARVRDKGQGLVVDVWPLAAWLTEEVFSELTDTQRRGLHRACDEQQGRVSWSFVDRVLTDLGVAYLLGVLYPVTGR